METETITIAQVKASDIIVFFGTEYKVRSVWKYADRSEIVFHDTNMHQPYAYTNDAQFIRRVAA